MSGIDRNFVNAFNTFKTDGKLDSNELKELRNISRNAKATDQEAVKDLARELKSSANLAFGVGASIENRINLNLLKDSINPTDSNITQSLQRGFKTKEGSRYNTSLESTVSTQSVKPSTFNIPKTVGPYHLSESKQLGKNKDVTFAEFQDKNNDPTHTLRMYAFDPKAVDIRVQRGNPKGGAIPFTSLLGQNNFITAINGVTMNGVPVGDVKGEVPGTKTTKVSQLENNQTAANGRWSIAVNKDGNVSFVKGGLQGPEKRANASNPDNYKYFLNGGSMLFNKQYNSEEDFYTHFGNIKMVTNSKGKPTPVLVDSKISNNDASMINNMKPSQDKPRSAIGITADGKVAIITFGEGIFRPNAKNPNPKQGGVTAYEMYQTLSKMGIKQAIMLDGGGAPGIIEKNANGFVTEPYHVGGDDYRNNCTFISIFDK